MTRRDTRVPLRAVRVRTVTAELYDQVEAGRFYVFRTDHLNRMTLYRIELPFLIRAARSMLRRAERGEEAARD